MEQYFPDFQSSDFDITKVTRLKQQRLILEIHNYRSCDASQRQQLTSKARQVAKICAKPVYIFRELMHYLQEQRIVAPGYSFMQNTIGKALTDEQERLTNIVRKHLMPSDVENLNCLLEDSTGLYEITQLKREPKDFNLSEIKREIHRQQQIHDLYQLTKTLLPHLLISNESIKYYASLVSYYSVYKLKRLNEWTAYVYLLCFVYHRYQRCHDNLILSLIHHVRQYSDEAKLAAKERVYQYRIEANLDLQKAGQVLKLFTDDSIAEQTPFYQVQAEAFSILERSKLDFIADHITSKATFDETVFAWEHIDNLAHQFKRNLRPILLAIDFAASPAHAPLIEAVDLLKEAFRKGKSLRQYSTNAFPVRFIPDKIKRYLYRQETPEPKQLLVDRYEFLVYRLLRNGLEAGDIYCRDSVRFRSFEDDLVDDEQWQKKEQLIAETGLTSLKQPIKEHLVALEQMLEARITAVNQHIAAGENEHLEVKKRGQHISWTLQSPGVTERVNHPLFEGLKPVDLSALMSFVHQRCQFMDGFNHVLGR